MSPSTTSPGGISASAPSRRTRAVEAFSRASLSRAAFARNSCSEPMSALPIAAKPNKASCQRPMTNSPPKRAKTIPLNS